LFLIFYFFFILVGQDHSSTFGIERDTLSPEEFFDQWSPKAFDAIIEDMIEEIGRDRCRKCESEIILFIYL